MTPCQHAGLLFQQANCTRKFDEAAADPRLCFFLAKSRLDPIRAQRHMLLPFSTLKPHYTHLLSTGCTIPIATLHPALFPLDHIIPALLLVHWYTEHPTHPPGPPPHQTEHVSDRVGQCCARRGADAPYTTRHPPSSTSTTSRPPCFTSSTVPPSATCPSSDGAAHSRAAFTTKELRELTTLPGGSVVPLSPELVDPPPAGTKLSRKQSHILRLLQQGQASPCTPPPTAASPSIQQARNSVLVPRRFSLANRLHSRRTAPNHRIYCARALRPRCPQAGPPICAQTES